MARMPIWQAGWALLVFIALHNCGVEAERVDGVVDLGAGPSHRGLPIAHLTIDSADTNTPFQRRERLGSSMDPKAGVPAGASPLEAAEMMEDDPAEAAEEKAEATQMAALSQTRSVPAAPADPAARRHVLNRELEDLSAEYKAARDPDKALEIAEKMSRVHKELEFHERLTQHEVDKTTINRAFEITEHRKYSQEARKVRSDMLKQNLNLNYGIHALEGKSEFDAEVSHDPEVQEDHQITDAIAIQKAAQTVEDAKVDVKALQMRMASTESELAGLQKRRIQETKTMSLKQVQQGQMDQRHRIELAKEKVKLMAKQLVHMKNATKIADEKGETFKANALRGATGTQAAFLEAAQRQFETLTKARVEKEDDPNLMSLAVDEQNKVEAKAQALREQELAHQLLREQTQMTIALEGAHQKKSTILEDLERLRAAAGLANAAIPGGNSTGGGNETSGDNVTAAAVVPTAAPAIPQSLEEMKLELVAHEAAVKVQNKFKAKQVDLVKVEKTISDLSAKLAVTDDQINATETVVINTKAHETAAADTVQIDKSEAEDLEQENELKKDIQKTKDREEVAEEVVKQQEAEAAAEKEEKEEEEKKKENEPSDEDVDKDQAEKVDILAANETASATVTKSATGLDNVEIDVEALESSANQTTSKVASVGNATSQVEIAKEGMEALKGNETELTANKTKVTANATSAEKALEEASAEAKSAVTSASAVANASATGEEGVVEEAETKEAVVEEAEKKEAVEQEVEANDRTQEVEDEVEMAAVKAEESKKSIEVDSDQARLEGAKEEVNMAVDANLSKEAKVEKALSLIEKAASKLPNVVAYKDAEERIQNLKKRALAVKNKLQQAAKDVQKSGGDADIDTQIAKEALQVASQDDSTVQQQNAAEMLNSAANDMAQAEAEEETPPAQLNSATDSSEDSPATAMVHALEKADVKEKSEQLHQLQVVQEGTVLETTAQTASQAADLDKLLAELRFRTNAVAQANGKANELKATLSSVNSDAEKKQIGFDIKLQREEAAHLHLQVEAMIKRVARKKIALRTQGAQEAASENEQEEKVQAAEKKLQKAAKQEEQDTNDAVETAVSDGKAKSNQVAVAKMQQQKGQEEVTAAEAKIQALQQQALEPSNTKDSAEQARIQAEVSAMEIKLQKVTAESDQAAANVASAEEIKATADTHEVTSLDTKLEAEEAAAKEAALDDKSKVQDAVDADALVEKAKKRAKEAKSAVETAATPADAAALSKKLAAAETAASQAEEESTKAQTDATNAKRKEEADQVKVAVSKAKLAAVEAPYKVKSEHATSKYSKEQYTDALKDVVRNSGLNFENTPEWINAQAIKLATPDAPAPAPAPAPAVKSRVADLGDSNTAIQKQLQQQLARLKLQQQQSDVLVGDAFKQLSNAAATNPATKPTSTSSMLQSVVSAAVRQGGKSGVLSNMLDSLDDTDSNELGESESESKHVEDHMLNDVFDELDAPISLLQLSKWTWQGGVPAAGIPHAPNTPHSTSPDELFKQAVGKAEVLAGKTSAASLNTSDGPAVAVDDTAKEGKKEASIQDIKQGIEHDTKAMNEASDQTVAMNLAKKIEKSKQKLEVVQTKATATTQAAENKVQKEEGTIVAKERAADVSNAVVQATEIAGDALKNAVETKEEFTEEVNKAVKKVQTLKKSIAESTSVGQIDVLTAKLEAQKGKTMQDRADLKRAVMGVTDAGVSELLQGVKAGVVSGDNALAKVKQMKQDKLQGVISEAHSKVQKAKMKVVAEESSIDEDKKTIAKVQAAEKAADNLDAAKTGEMEIAKLKEKIEQQKADLSASKDDVKHVEQQARAVLKKSATEEEQLRTAADQALRSVQRNEKAEASALRHVKKSVSKDAVQVGAEQGAAAQLKEEKETAKVAAEKTSSALLKGREMEKEKQAAVNEKETEKQLKKDDTKLQKDQEQARRAKKRLMGKIKGAMAKVVSAKPSQDTALERQKERGVEAAANNLRKQNEANQKVQATQVRVTGQLARRKRRLAQTQEEVVELQTERQRHMDEIKTKGQSSDTDARTEVAMYADGKSAQDEMQQLDKEIKAKTPAIAKEEHELNTSERAYEEIESFSQEAKRNQQQDVLALKRAKEDQAQAKVAATTQQLTQEGKGADVQALEIESARKSEEQKENDKIVKDREEVERASQDESNEEKTSVTPLTESVSSRHEEMKKLANALLRKAGFG